MVHDDVQRRFTKICSTIVSRALGKLVEEPYQILRVFVPAKFLPVFGAIGSRFSKLVVAKLGSQDDQKIAGAQDTEATFQEAFSI